MMQKNWTESQHREHLATHPCDHVSLYALGLLLKKQQKFAEAAALIARAVQEQPDNIYYRNVLVSTLWLDGQHAAAYEQGLACLTLKDRLAFQGFDAQRYQLPPLKATHPPFDVRNKHRNVIAYSLWGDNPVYVTGAVINAQLIPYIYDGWTARFYCDDTVPPKALEALRQLDAQVVMIEDPALRKLRSMWRFFAADDPQVDYFLCRDADARVNVKEAIAVQAWLQSGKKFHIMRDHAYHVELILAGMWGGVAGALPSIQKMLLTSGKYNNNPLFDQVFLMEVIWPMIKNDVLVHDSFYRYPFGTDYPPVYQLPAHRHIGGGTKSIPPKQQDFYQRLYCF